MYPKGQADPSYDAVQLRLYWMLMAEEVEGHIARFREKGRQFTMTEGYEKRLKFYYSGDVPSFVKTKAAALLQELNREFGRNNIPRPTN